MASAVGLEVLRVIEDEKLQENCHTIGTYLLKKLERLRDRYETVGDVRGKGLMIGVEMVETKEGKTPLNSHVFGSIWEDCKDGGLLLGVGGLKGNVFRIKPPMCITRADVDFAVDTLESAIKAHSF